MEKTTQAKERILELEANEQQLDKKIADLIDVRDSLLKELELSKSNDADSIRMKSKVANLPPRWLWPLVNTYTSRRLDSNQSNALTMNGTDRKRNHKESKEANNLSTVADRDSPSFTNTKRLKKNEGVKSHKLSDEKSTPKKTDGQLEPKKRTTIEPLREEASENEKDMIKATSESPKSISQTPTRSIPPGSDKDESVENVNKVHSTANVDMSGTEGDNLQDIHDERIKNVNVDTNTVVNSKSKTSKTAGVDAEDVDSSDDETNISVNTKDVPARSDSHSQADCDAVDYRMEPNVRPVAPRQKNSNSNTKEIEGDQKSVDKNTHTPKNSEPKKGKTSNSPVVADIPSPLQGSKRRSNGANDGTKDISNNADTIIEDDEFPTFEEDEDFDSEASPTLIMDNGHSDSE
eukprot:CFRG1799T1